MKLPLHFRLLRTSLKFVSHVAPVAVGAFYAQKFMTPRRVARPPWEAEILNLAIERGRLDGCQFWAWGSGPTVILVHGWEGRGSQLGQFIEPLVTSGFRVVIWDAPAHGDSNGRESNLALAARSLKRLADTQSDVFAIVAHSFGGNVAQLAVDSGLGLKRLVLISTPRSIQVLFDRFTEFTRISHPARVAFQARVESATGMRAQDLDRLDRPQNRQPEILVIHALDDKEVPYADGHTLSREKSHMLYAVAGAGHRRILRDTRVIERTLDFLQTVPPARLPQA